MTEHRVADFSTDICLAWRLARRELRGGLAGFRIFLGSLALGVAAISGVGSTGEAIEAGLAADGRKLLGGDVDLRLHTNPPTSAQIDHLLAGGAILSAVAEMRAMAWTTGATTSAPKRRALVELKAVDKVYPLVGTVITDPQQPFQKLLSRRDETWGAVVDAGLLRRLGLAVGDKTRVGEAVFEIRATVIREPDQVASVLSFGPRFFIAKAALTDTGLVQPGSHIHFNTRLLLPPGVAFEAWKTELLSTYPKAGWRIRSQQEAAPGIRRFIDRMGLFMAFVGLTVLLVGGIGVAGSVASYLDGKTAAIASFKCLGAPGRLVFLTYMLQIAALSVVGIGIGLAVGGGLPFVVTALIGELLPTPPVAAFYPQPMALAALFGMVTAMTFALWPVARAREVPAAALFRDAIAPANRMPKPAYRWATGLGIVVLAALTVVTSDDRIFAAWFVGGALATIGLLRLGARLVMKAAAANRLPVGAAMRLAQANLHRPGAATPGVVLSLGLGFSALVAVALIEGNLSLQINERLPERAPAFFFLDIQPHQTAAFDAAVTGVSGTTGYHRVPTLRGRIVGIAGTPVEKATIDPGVEWAIRGDRALTFAVEKPLGSRLTAGAWWPADYQGPPLISLDARLTRGFGIGLGDTLTLNVLGREISAEIASLREIDWHSLRFDFAIIFAPGTLDGAPMTHIAAVEASPAIEDAVEAAATDEFSNVSAIRVREALEAAAGLLAGVGVAVRGTAALTVLAGVLVLAGAIAANRRRRRSEAVVFKVLGASRKRVLVVFLTEYGILGLVTGVLGAAVGTLTAWAVVRFLMHSEWVFLSATVASTIAACVAVTLVAGFAGTWRALGQKAAPLLRNA